MIHDTAPPSADDTIEMQAIDFSKVDLSTPEDADGIPFIIDLNDPWLEE